ncbi:MAG: PUA domain-containing protein [Candidatus Jordarchaeales archaeon]
MEENNYWVLRKLRLIADYQFLPGAGKALFPENVNVYFSSKTGRVKEIRLGGELVASFRPDDGTFALSIRGAELLLRNFQKPRLRAIIEETVADVVAEGRNVFAKHVVEADPEIRSGDEVIVVDERDILVAVGKAVLSGEEMVAFSRGIAVKTRIGNPLFKSN